MKILDLEFFGNWIEIGLKLDQLEADGSGWKRMEGDGSGWKGMERSMRLLTGASEGGARGRDRWASWPPLEWALTWSSPKVTWVTWCPVTTIDDADECGKLILASAGNSTLGSCCRPSPLPPLPPPPPPPPPPPLPFRMICIWQRREEGGGIGGGEVWEESTTLPGCFR